MSSAKPHAVKDAFARLRQWLDQTGAPAASGPSLAAATLAQAALTDATLTDLAGPVAGAAAWSAADPTPLAGSPGGGEADCALDALELLWGDDRLEPAAPAEQAERLALLDPEPGDAFAWLGAGLGGGARAAAARYDLEIDAYEWRPDWLRRARAREAVRDPLARGAVRLRSLAPDTPELEARRLDGAVTLERLWTLADPAPLLRATHAALRPGAMLVAVEWVLDEGAATADAFGPAGPRLADLEAWRARFAACRFDLRVEEDGTGAAIAHYRAGIERFAGDFESLAERALAMAHSKHVVYELTRALNEALQRVAALERGDAAVFRFLAARADALSA